MDLCETYRVSYSHWRGGPALWSDEDRAKAIAWQRYKNAGCPRCKTRRDDWEDEDGVPLRRPTWTVTYEQCPGCEAMHPAEKHLEDKDGRARGFAVTWALTDEFDPTTERTP